MAEKRGGKRYQILKTWAQWDLASMVRYIVLIIAVSLLYIPFVKGVTEGQIQTILMFAIVGNSLFTIWALVGWFGLKVAMKNDYPKDHPPLTLRILRVTNGEPLICFILFVMVIYGIAISIFYALLTRHPGNSWPSGIGIWIAGWSIFSGILATGGGDAAIEMAKVKSLDKVESVDDGEKESQ